MSDWIACSKCGVFTSVGMRVDSSEAYCNACSESSSEFYHPEEEVEEGQLVEARDFIGYIEYYSITETQVEIKESNTYSTGETIHIDPAYLKPSEQNALSG